MENVFDYKARVHPQSQHSEKNVNFEQSCFRRVAILPRQAILSSMTYRYRLLKVALLCVVPLSSCLGASSPQLQIGSTLDEAKAILGEPEGLIELGNKKVLFYRLGELTVSENKVVKADFISEKTFLTIQTQKEKNRLRLQEQKEARTAAQIAAGTKLKKKKQSDPHFLSQPPAERLFFWESFIRAYPQVDVMAEYLSAKAERQAEREAEKAALNKAKVEALEQQLAQAEHDAEKARQKRYRYDRSRSYRNPYFYSGTRYEVCTDANTGNTVTRIQRNPHSFSFSNGAPHSFSYNIQPQSVNPVTVVTQSKK